MSTRIALALLVIVPAVMAYPFQTVTERWVLGVAIAVVVVVFAWWRGLFATTMIRRVLAVWRRNRSAPPKPVPNRVLVLLEVKDPRGVGLSLPLVAGYVDRFGVKCDNVRITGRDEVGTRTTWIGMTLDADDNLAALRARSPELPLYDTAEIVGRRLADHLRETGLEASIVVDAPATLVGSVKETWSAVRDDLGYLTAFGVRVDHRLGELVAGVAAHPGDTWVALEFSGTAQRPGVAAACAFRSAAPVKEVPAEGLVAHRGVQRPLLTALDPTSPGRLGIAPVPLPDGLLERMGWRVGAANPAPAEQTRL